MDNMEINLESVISLLDRAESDHDVSLDMSQGMFENESQKSLRSGSVRGTLAKGFDTAKGLLSSLVSVKDKEADKKGHVDCDKLRSQRPVKSVQNCYQKRLEDVTNEKTRRDALIADLQKKYEDLENKRNQEKDSFETCLKEQTDKLDKEFDKKVEDVEIKCDEARQREMKGTLIVSSPSWGGRRTEAEIRVIRNEDTGATGPESELDMVLRMVYDKTGVWIPYEDVAACHRIGNKNNNSYVLKVWNRKRFSPWHFLTEGMLTGKTFSPQNIYINFLLTTRRIELSKQVRQAKKDNLIQKYSIDQNGKIFVKKLGNDNVFHLVSSKEDLENLTTAT